VRTGLLLCLLCALCSAQTTFVDWRDLKPGAQGKGRTVFAGETVSDFDVEVLGVLENSGPRQALILAKLRGGPLDRTGVMQGMSGSPVYFGGRLAGAVAFAFPFAKETIAGIRPIQEMLAAADPVPAQPLRARASIPFGEARLEEIATPVAFQGFTPATLDHFRDQLRQFGFEPRQGVSGGSAPANAAPGDPKRLQPGSMISVQLMTGDLSIGADGTVTHIDGNRLYAFGHRFLSIGDADLPFARAEVVTLLPTLTTSFKISNAREWMGSITTDRNAGVAGVLGRRARLVPLRITVESDANGRPRRETYQMQLAGHRVLAPFLTQMAVFSSLDATERSVGSSTVDVDAKVRLNGGLDPIVVRNRFAGDFTPALPAAMAIAQPLAALLESGLPGLQVEGIEVGLKLNPVRRQLRLDQAWLSRKEVRAGEEVEVHLSLLGDEGVETRRSVRYRVPGGLEPGPLQLSILDAGSANLYEARALYAGGALSGKSAREFVGALNRLKSNSGLTLRAGRTDATYMVGTAEMSGLPASAALVMAKSPLAGGGVWGSMGSKLGEIDVDFGEWLVSGSKALTLTVTP